MELEKIRMDIFGWFDKPEDTSPTHDPGLDVNCIFCGQKLQKPLKTISLMKEGDSKSYFYRSHKDCYENMNYKDIVLVESSLIDA